MESKAGLYTPFHILLYTNNRREIVDESDVYIDVHKAIRRLTPAPRARCGHVDVAAAAGHAGTAIAAKKTSDNTTLVGHDEADDGSTLKVGSLGALSDGGDGRYSPKVAVLMKRRGSVGPDGRVEAPISVKTSLKEMKSSQLRLGPANRAAHPRSNTRNVFKIKQGLTPHQRVTTLKVGAGAVNGDRTPSVQSIAEALHTEPEHFESLPAAAIPDPQEEQQQQQQPDDETTPLLNSHVDGAETIKPYGANGNSKSKKNKKGKKK